MKCSICGEDHSRANLLESDDGLICLECASKYKYARCTCGKIFKTDGFRNLCNHCSDVIYGNGINNYSAKPNPIFKNHNSDITKNLGCRYYGLEMEYSNVNPDTVHDLGQKLYDEKFMYNKRDGSLRGGGVEVVTSPMDKSSVNYLLDNMEDVFKYIKGVKGYSLGAGVHIHVSLSTIDLIDRYKLSILLNTFSSRIENHFMYYLSGRNRINQTDSEHHYCTIGNTDRLNFHDITARHIALNMNNKNTFEFRIFKSTADVNLLKSYIYIVDSMIDFCHNHGLKDISISNYAIYLKGRKDNKVVEGKIKRFEKRFGEFKKDSRVTSTQMVLDKIKDLPTGEYYKLLSCIGRKGFRNTKEINNIIDNYLTHRFDDKPLYRLDYYYIKLTSGSQNNVVKYIENKIKDMVLSKVRIEELCA